MVGKKRLELLNLSVLVPKTSAYTNSATCPYMFYKTRFYISLCEIITTKISNTEAYILDYF